MHLPVELCEQLLTICHQEGIAIDDDFANIFADFQNSRLKQLSLANSPVTDQGMRCLLGHNLKAISLVNCVRLSRTTLDSINESSDNLVSLAVIPCTVEVDQQHDIGGEQVSRRLRLYLSMTEPGALQQILPVFLDTDNPDEDDFTDDEREDREENKYYKRRWDC